MISPVVAAGLSLTPVGAANVTHAGGSSISKTYMVNFGLPNMVMFVGALVSEFPGVGAGCEALVGMDIISMGDFSITNFGGQTCMSFRTPSVASVDYVAEHNRLAFAGTGRNDPCPCGARDSTGNSIKFKRCHGKP